MITFDLDNGSEAELRSLRAKIDARLDSILAEKAAAEKAALAKSCKRDNLRCETCGGAMRRDGFADGRQRYRCPTCGRRTTDTAGTSLSHSRLSVDKIDQLITLIVLGVPDWVIAWVADVNAKTAQFWRDRALDAAVSWSSEATLRGHVHIDEMQFAPTREGDGVITADGSIAKNLYMEVAFDSRRQGFCHFYYGKPGMPTSDMVLDCLAERVERGSKLTHDGAPSHKALVKRLGLVDDCHGFDPEDEAYKESMKLLNKCCSYIRHCFERHKGIKAGKAEAYANLFLYIWCHKRSKRGLKFVIECLRARIFGTEKSHGFDDYGRKNEVWSRK